MTTPADKRAIQAVLRENLKESLRGTIPDDQLNKETDEIVAWALKRAQDVRGKRKMHVGDRVRKFKGYEFDGTVVSVFKNLAGEERLVVESTLIPGMLHIFSPWQMKKVR